jgi:hypothetical protein
MYQIEVQTTSESQETRSKIVRFNPQAVQRAVEDSLKNNIQVGIQCFKWRRGTIRIWPLSPLWPRGQPWARVPARS